jgi:hypothetical protein
MKDSQIESVFTRLWETYYSRGIKVPRGTLAREYQQYTGGYRTLKLYTQALHRFVKEMKEGNKKRGRPPTFTEETISTVSKFSKATVEEEKKIPSAKDEELFSIVHQHQDEASKELKIEKKKQGASNDNKQVTVTTRTIQRVKNKLGLSYKKIQNVPHKREEDETVMKEINEYLSQLQKVIFHQKKENGSTPVTQESVKKINIQIDRKGSLENEDIPNILVVDEIGFKPYMGENQREWGIRNGTSAKFIFEELGTTTVMVTVGLFKKQDKIVPVCHYFIIRRQENGVYEASTVEGQKLVTSDTIKGMTGDILESWIENLVSTVDHQPFILLWDNLKCHHTEGVKRHLQKCNITCLSYPPYTAKYLSILDNTIFGWFKVELSKEVAEHQKDLTNNDTFCAWLATHMQSFFSKLTVEQILQAMKKCGISDLMLGHNVQLNPNIKFYLQKDKKNSLLFNQHNADQQQVKEDKHEQGIDDDLYNKLVKFRNDIYKNEKEKHRSKSYNPFHQTSPEKKDKKLLSEKYAAHLICIDTPFIKGMTFPPSREDDREIPLSIIRGEFAVSQLPKFPINWLRFLTQLYGVSFQKTGSKGNYKKIDLITALQRQFQAVDSQTVESLKSQNEIFESMKEPLQESAQSDENESNTVHSQQQQTQEIGTDEGCIQETESIQKQQLLHESNESQTFKQFPQKIYRIYGLGITQEHLDTLLDTQCYLYDYVIDAMGYHFTLRFPTIYYWNTSFCQFLHHQFEKAVNFNRDVRFFPYQSNDTSNEVKYIYIPMCFENHWTLFIVDVFDQMIINLNSLQNQEVPIQLVRSWVHRRQLFENNQAREFRVIKPNVPRQQDLTSCGVYAITFMEHATKAIASNLQLSDVWQDWSYIIPNAKNFAAVKRRSLFMTLRQLIEIGF